jgi:hypothetical protein
MNRNRSLRQLLAKTCDDASEKDTAKESTSVTRRIRFGDFKIDLDERLVTLRDQELGLTSEEFDVLVFMASHPRSLVTPQTMLARSSTANQLGQTKFLTALVSLRKKLAPQVMGSTTFRLSLGSSIASIQLRRPHNEYRHCQVTPAPPKHRCPSRHRTRGSRTSPFEW